MMNTRRQTRPGLLRRNTPAKEEVKVCFFCVGNNKQIHEQDVETLGRFLSTHGKIMPRRRSGVCAFHQRKLANAIKRARILSLLPFAV